MKLLPIKPNASILDVPQTFFDTNQASSSSALTPAIQTLAKSISTNSLCSLNLDLSVSQAHEFFQALVQSRPYAYMALQEVSSRSKAFATINSTDVLPQFFRAKTALQLPKAESVLSALHLNTQGTQSPDASKILATLIERHIPSLIDNSIAALQTISNPIQELETIVKLLTNMLTFVATLSTHPAGKTQQFWEIPFSENLIKNLDCLLRTYAEIENSTTHWLNMHISHTEPRKKEMAQTLLTRMEQARPLVKQVTSWTEKIETLTQLRTKKIQEVQFKQYLRNDRDVMRVIIQATGGVGFNIASPALQNDRDFVLSIVKNQGLALQHVCEALREDREVVLAAIQNNGWAIAYAHPTLQDDPALRKIAGFPMEEQGQ